jgi:hypothetical protein
MTTERLTNKRGNKRHRLGRGGGSLCASALLEAINVSPTLKITANVWKESPHKDASGNLGTRSITRSQGKSARTTSTIPIAHQYGPAVSSLEAY